MRIHHLSCGTMCPVGGRLMRGRPGPARLVCHCLLIETPRHGLVLVDTGFGLEDVRRPLPRLSALMLATMRVAFDERATAVRQVQAHGFAPRDVRHIVLTHLDFDHAGGLGDFPDAAVHVLDAELNAAFARRGAIAARRYRPAQWPEGAHWRTYRASGERWFGFEAVRDLAGLPPEILMVPLIGHTSGHAGIAIRADDGWLLHAGDAYFFHGEMDPARPRCPPGLAAYQRLMEVDRGARLANQARLRGLVGDPTTGVRVFCAHDVAEFDAYAAEARRMLARERRAALEWISEVVAGPDGRPTQDALLDTALAETFPASDPTTFQQPVRTGGFTDFPSPAPREREGPIA